jgi:hypothetical protein
METPCTATGPSEGTAQRFAAMTKSELRLLVDRLPESVFEGSHEQLDASGGDLRALSRVVIALANRLEVVTQEWMAGQGFTRHEDGETGWWE